MPPLYPFLALHLSQVVSLTNEGHGIVGRQVKIPLIAHRTRNDDEVVGGLTQEFTRRTHTEVDFIGGHYFSGVGHTLNLIVITPDGNGCR